MGHSWETRIPQLSSVLTDVFARVRTRANASVRTILKMSRQRLGVKIAHAFTVLRDRFSIENIAYNWFQSYLSDRQQSFVYNGQQTTFFPLDCSVPQGSVLGLLEFVAYTDDISDVVALAKHDIN